MFGLFICLGESKKKKIIYYALMSNIFKKIKDFFILQRKKELANKIQKVSKRSYENKTSKVILGDGTKVTINAKTQEKINEVKENITAIVKKTNCEPKALLDYVQAANTKVYRIDNPNKFLACIKEEEGFICEQEGVAALFLSLIVGEGVKFKTEPMFVVRKSDNINKSFLLHNFYRWYSYKSGLGGFEYKARKRMKEYMADNSLEVTKKLSLDTIIMIEEAIAREREANQYVLAYETQTEGSKNVINKIKNDGSAEV